MIARWSKGPTFLYDNEEKWQQIPKPDKNFPEETTLHSSVLENYCVSESVPAIKNHYTWVKLLRVTARTYRSILLLESFKNRKETFLNCREMLWNEKLQWKVILRFY